MNSRSHGDLLFASYSTLAPREATPPPSPSATLSGQAVEIEPALVPVPSASSAKVDTKGGKKLWELAIDAEEAVDKYWEPKNGQIERKKGNGGCVCGPKAMCDYCMPLEVCRLFVLLSSERC